MKELVEDVDATPSKRTYFSIISDYDVNRSICELIDNALDNWIKEKPKNNLEVDINIDIYQKNIKVTDNSGGVEKKNLKYIVGPGQTGNDPSDICIGFFGVGTKRAVVALSKNIKILTRYKNLDTYQVEFDDSWIMNDDGWSLPVYKVDSIPESKTIVELINLRKEVNEEILNKLRIHLQKTYARFIENHNIIIRINGSPLEPIKFENWAYPPSYEPRNFNGRLSFSDGRGVNVNILAGLSKESSPTGDYGVYFYCNNRLVASNQKNFHVGFGKGLAGKPHPKISLIKVFVNLEGEASLMPWNSSKSGMDYNHQVFIGIQKKLIEIVKYFAAVSRSLDDWPETVSRFSRGTIREEPIEFESGRNLYLPPVPISRPRYPDRLKEMNKLIAKDKPWTKGLYETMGIVDWVAKRRNIETRNRVSLIILDSNLEIAFKEYLVNETEEHYNDNRIRTIFNNRNNTIREIEKHIRLTKTEKGKINYYYQLRNKLIHERATVGIRDEQINDYKELVEKILRRLFRLRFN